MQAGKITAEGCCGMYKNYRRKLFFFFFFFDLNKGVEEMTKQLFAFFGLCVCKKCNW